MIIKQLCAEHFSKEFAYRDKVGFLAPVGSWLRDNKGLGRYLDLLTDKHTTAPARSPRP